MFGDMFQLFFARKLIKLDENYFVVLYAIPPLNGFTGCLGIVAPSDDAGKVVLPSDLKLVAFEPRDIVEPVKDTDA